MIPTDSDLAADLHGGLAELGLSLPAPACAALLDYLALLARWNRTYNLSAVREPRQMLIRHLLDSLAVLPWLHGTSLADIGTGPGLPGIPLALARPGLRVLLVDSNGKKARFLREAVRVLDLGGRCTVAQARAETLLGGADDGNDTLATSGYDTVVSRAFASLADFVVASRGLLAPGGRWLALKGQRPDDEIASLPPGIDVQAIVPLMVPGLAAQRHAIIMACSDNPGQRT